MPTHEHHDARSTTRAHQHPTPQRRLHHADARGNPRSTPAAKAQPSAAPRRAARGRSS